MDQFDSLICVDYSAAAKPTTGQDSIWLAGHLLGSKVLMNHSTRASAHEWLNTVMVEHVSLSKRVLVGFDFAFGYPTGFAAALGLTGRPWKSTWKYLERALIDSPNNENNRFEVANAINKQLGDKAVFWGRPHQLNLPFLPTKKNICYDNGIKEWRQFEALGREKGSLISRMQPSWKLAYAGSVGSQALMGIANLQRHRQKFAEKLAIWPFEEPTSPIVFAEVYPSMFKFEHIPHRIKDAKQVQAMVQVMKRNSLSNWLDRTRFRDNLSVVDEEGWLLGWPQ